MADEQDEQSENQGVEVYELVHGDGRRLVVATDEDGMVSGEALERLLAELNPDERARLLEGLAYVQEHPSEDDEED